MNAKTITQKRVISAFILAFCLLTFALVPCKKTNAAIESWMATAQALELGSSDSGYAENNVAPTGMDPDWTYEKYYYFNVPTKLSVTLEITMPGTEPFTGVYLLNSDGSTIKELWNTSFDSDWTYSRSTRKSTLTYTVVLPKGDYYIKQWNIFAELDGNTYTTKLSAKLPTKPTLSKATKSASRTAKITWKKSSGVSGYQIYRSTSKSGKYTKIRTVSSRTTSYKNKGLKKNRTYYYKIRSYKKVGGKTYYSAFSSAKRVKL